ncbi:hypothetical protein BN2475_1130003 [Paraburkholderia ribeironis]|uniref:Uncharacterized protein n=1 Tax=Paraburkholderia ribeironis TaxID=1247936 RepID=A0A1N7SMX1_9BURK|nr:hypothetical protein BN2475_1130003 [Paraburkholderia ribeironis]
MHGSEARKRRAGRVATKLHRAGWIRVARRQYASHRNTPVADCAKRDSSRQAAGWTVGLHALPMHLADRMESLKERKAGPGRRGYGVAAQLAVRDRPGRIGVRHQVGMLRSTGNGQRRLAAAGRGG